MYYLERRIDEVTKAWIMMTDCQLEVITKITGCQLNALTLKQGFQPKIVTMKLGCQMKRFQQKKNIDARYNIIMKDFIV